MAKRKPVAAPQGKARAHLRNPVAHADIMKKGGAHQSSRKAVRQQARQQIHQQLRERSDRSCYPALAA